MRGGVVYLVGAGPGDPGLLTVRGAELLAMADVVVHDRLADRTLLELAPATARRVDVGKAPGGPVHQDQINELLIAEGRAGRCVVRLKGGDPFLFGRGGEECQALADAGVAFEVVPGITSAIAVPAYAGVPVTHRGLSTSLTVVTGHSRHDDDRETNWEALAAAGGTIVVLMGVAHRSDIAARLIAGGLAPETPVLAVHWGTRPEQRTVRVRLDQLGSTELAPPVTLVIGAVADLDLGWYERRPLFGRRVVVTRARAQASALVQKLRDLGARPIEVPTIRIESPSDGGAGLEQAVERLEVGHYQWVVFTSADAVDPLLGRLADIRALGAVRIAAVGPATSEALARYHLMPDLVPDRHLAEGLLAAFPDPPGLDMSGPDTSGPDASGPGTWGPETSGPGTSGLGTSGPGISSPDASGPGTWGPETSGPGTSGRVLFPRSAGGRDVLVEGLRAAGWEVDLVEAYRTVPMDATAEVREDVAGADAALFSSSSTVSGFVSALGVDAMPPVVVCIGPVTSATAADLGVRVDAVAAEHTLDGLVSALVGVLGPVSV